MSTARPADTDGLVGTTLDGRFQVVRKIAEGGMGAVYEAVQLKLNRKVAVKILHAHLAKDADIVARFRREALATTQIGHPHIVEVVDLGELADGALFLVLELLEGRDLGKVLKETGPLSIGRATRILSQVADGVGAAHEKGIVHRDLKPENVFLVENRGTPDFVKVVDFGVSKIKVQEGGLDSKTRTGTALGTPYFMPPEQAQGLKTVDHRADVYALGVILFRMLTGHYPFDDESYPMLVVKICTEAPPPAGEWRADLPLELAALIDRMLEKDPAARPQSCAEVKDALAQFTAMDEPPVLTGAPGPRLSKPRLFSSGATPATVAGNARTVRSDAPGPRSAVRSRPEHDEDAQEEDRAAVGIKAQGGSMLPMLVGALAIAALGVGGYAIFGMDEGGGGSDLLPEPEVVPLPEPGTPVVRPLARGARGTGWSWRNPRPRGMPTWNAVDVGGPDLVAFAGEGGIAARFVDDTTLVVWRSSTTEPLRGIEWTGNDQALVVGDHGTLVRLTMSGPQRIDAGTEADLHAVVSVTTTDALAVGDDGTILRVMGDRVVSLDASTEDDLLGAHVRRGDTYVVGGGGTILRFTDVRAGRFVREESRVDETLHAIGGCERGDLYAVGEHGTILRQMRDRSWHGIRPAAELRETLTGVGCDRGRAVLTGTNGVVALASGDSVVLLGTGFEETWYAASGAPDESTWVVGAGGHLGTIDVDHVAVKVDGPAVPLRDVATIGGAIVAVGEWGRILRESEDGHVLSDSPTDAGLAALAPLDEGHLLAVGDLGALVRIGWDGAELLTSPDTTVSYRDVVAEGGRVTIVGTGGAIVRGTPDALSIRRFESAGDLWSIAGAPDDGWAVGDHGTVLRVTGTDAIAVPCGVTASLRSVVVMPDGSVFAVGDGGTTIRVLPDGCVREHEGGPNLNAVGIGPHGRAFAVGDSGTTLERGEGGTWTESDLEAGSAHLRGIRRFEREVVVVGTGGTILEHVIVDGS